MYYKHILEYKRMETFFLYIGYLFCGGKYD